MNVLEKVKRIRSCLSESYEKMLFNAKLKKDEESVEYCSKKDTVVCVVLKKEVLSSLGLCVGC